jgi:hypothetical protein
MKNKIDLIRKPILIHLSFRDYINFVESFQLSATLDDALIALGDDFFVSFRGLLLEKARKVPRHLILDW